MPPQRSVRDRYFSCRLWTHWDNHGNAWPLSHKCGASKEWVEVLILMIRCHWFFRDGIRLSSDRTFIARNVLALDKDSICWNLHSLLYKDQISYHDIRWRELNLSSISHDIDSLVTEKSKIELEELLLLRIVVSSGYNCNDANCQENWGALNPSICQSVINDSYN